MSSLAEIQEVIEKLGPEERAELWTWFQEAEESDELVAAVDEGIRAAEEGRVFTLEEIKTQIAVVDYEVILTEPAREDLREIVAFIAQDNPPAAVTFRDRLIAKAESLVLFLIEDQSSTVSLLGQAFEVGVQLTRARDASGLAENSLILGLAYRGSTRLTHRTVLFWNAGHEQAQSQVAQVREALPYGRPL